MSVTAGFGATITLGDLSFRQLIDESTLRERIIELGREIATVYAEKRPLVIGVLNGGAPFHADLMRAMEIPLTVDYLRVASYGAGMISTGILDFTAECSTQIDGRYVIMVEDIVDTGRTVRRLREYFLAKGAVSVAVAALLYKREADLFGDPPDFVGFEIEDRFVVGFGLDYNQEGRNLRHIYVLEDAPKRTTESSNER